MAPLLSARMNEVCAALCFSLECVKLVSGRSGCPEFLNWQFGKMMAIRLVPLREYYDNKQHLRAC